MTLYTPVFLEHASNAPLEFERLCDEGGVLDITYRDNADSLHHIAFDTYWVYRKRDEGNALSTLHEIKISSSLAQWFYRVDDSSFIKWFHEETYGIRENKAIIHFLFAFSNDIVDVISSEVPEFS